LNAEYSKAENGKDQGFLDLNLTDKDKGLSKTEKLKWHELQIKH